MKYFTKELWASINGRGKYNRDEASRLWERNQKGYSQQLERLRPKLSVENYSFFKETSLHDGRLLAFVAGDGIDHDAQGGVSFDINARNTAARMRVPGAEMDALYTLDYRSVRRMLFDFPSAKPLFYREGDHIADWGYDELTAPDEDYFRHQILFSSGATILIEFKEFTWRHGPCVGSRYPERS